MGNPYQEDKDKALREIRDLVFSKEVTEVGRLVNIATICALALDDHSFPYTQIPGIEEGK